MDKVLFFVLNHYSGLDMLGKLTKNLGGENTGTQAAESTSSAPNGSDGKESSNNGGFVDGIANNPEV